MTTTTTTILWVNKCEDKRSQRLSTSPNILRTTKHVAHDGRRQYPLVYLVLRRDLYVKELEVKHGGHIGVTHYRMYSPAGSEEVLYDGGALCA